MNAIVCIQKIFERQYDVSLTDTQAEDIWKGARAYLNKQGSRRIVKAIKECTNGSLDTMEREFLMDAIGQTITSRDWPYGMGDELAFHRFHEKMFAYMRKIGVITPAQDQYLNAIKTLIEVDDSMGSTIRVQKRRCGLYDVARKNQQEPDEAYVIRHPDCSADDAIRALGHYLTAQKSVGTLQANQSSETGTANVQ